LDISSGNHLNSVRFEPPAQRERGIMVEDVAGLVAAIKDRGLL
jgi:electron transfer flavoprotein beta subunit